MDFNLLKDFLNSDTTQKDFAVRQIYMEALEGLVSKNDLIESNRARLLKYAIDERKKALSFINELLAVNPGATFDYLAGSSVDYQNAITVINWLSDETPKP